MNHSVGPTRVVNDGSGPALKLRTGKHEPPLAVTSRVRVQNLNADTVDGLQGKSLRTNARVFTIPGGGDAQLFLLKGVKPGRYLTTLSVALESTLPAGCGLQDSHTGDYLSFASGGSDGIFVGTSASAVITLPAGSSLLLGCNSKISDSTLFHNTVAVMPVGKITRGGIEALGKHGR